MKASLLKFHRWVALLFAVPLLLVLITGLALSFEPWLVVNAIKPGTVTPAKVESLLRQHDPHGQARSLVYRSYDNTLTISAGRGGGTVVDVATGQALSQPSTLSRFLVTMRRLHQTLLIQARWIVIASTAAMLMLGFLGVLMGLPRFTNSLSGWHKATAWGLLPLIVLSPLTALLMAYGVTFSGASPTFASARGSPILLSEAVQILAKDRDLSTLVWIRPRGNRLLARFVEGGEYVVYTVTRAGPTVTPRNWPRLWHEGNFAGAWSAAMNIIVSIAMIGLLVTGTSIWLRRQLRLRGRRSVRPGMEEFARESADRI